MMTKKNPMRECGTTQPITEDDYWDDVIQTAAKLGLIKDTGERRDGQIVWERTETTLDNLKFNKGSEQ